MQNAPSTRIGWHSYYAQRYNRTGNPDAAVMACWYYPLHLAFDGDA